MKKMKKMKKLKKGGGLLTICQETCPFSLSKTKNTLKRKETFKQEPDQVEDIEPSTPFNREQFQNRWSNRGSNRLRKLRISLRFRREEGTKCQMP